MTPKKRTSPILSFIIFFMVTSLLAIILLTVLVIFGISRLENAIGPSSADLPLLTRMSLSVQLIGATGELQKPVLTHQTPTYLQIAPGDSPVQICRRLSALSEIQDCQLFVNYMVYKGLDRKILAGKFSIPSGDSMLSLAELITDPSAMTVRFSLLPGWRVEEVAHSLSLSGLLEDPDVLVEHVRQAQLEGFLYPSEYDLARDIPVKSLTETFTGRFNQMLSEEIIVGFQTQELSIREAVILASIVQREAIHAEEMPTIASVYLNRLRIPMKLEADPTVQYALGFHDGSWWKSPLALSDLQVDSPFNTYLHPGLPPAPIANPGLQALRAVAYPDSTEYLYFRNTCDNSGYHVFSTNFNEHLQNECP